MVLSNVCIFDHKVFLIREATVTNGKVEKNILMVLPECFYPK